MRRGCEELAVAVSHCGGLERNFGMWEVSLLGFLV